MKKDSLFILGAGVSVDHGYPTGLALLEDIVNILEEKTPLLFVTKDFTNKELLVILLCLTDSHNGKEFSEINEFQYKELVETFRTRIKYSTPRSIDDFIHNQTQGAKDPQKKGIEKLGKLLIVLRLFRYEGESLHYDRTSNSEDPTYKRLLGKIYGEKSDFVYKQAQTFFTSFWQSLYGMSYDEFIENLNKTRFITFNYDRLLEHFIYDSAKNFYPNSKNVKKDLRVFFENNITHVYGRLPSLNWEADSGSEYGSLDSASFKRFLVEIKGKVLKTCIDQYDTDFFEKICEESKTVFVNRKVRAGKKKLTNESNVQSKKANKEIDILDYIRFLAESISGIRTYTESVEDAVSKIDNQFEHIYFLGFSFHRLNIERLLELICSPKQSSIYSTVYGMKKQEVICAEKLLKEKIFLQPNGHMNAFWLVEKFEMAQDLKINEFFKSVSDVRFIN